MSARPEVWWSTWPEALRLLVTGQTRRTALPVCLAVGTLLSLVNQGDLLLTGQVDLVTAVRVAANYAIPYLVSSIGWLAARRAPRRQT